MISCCESFLYKISCYLSSLLMPTVCDLSTELVFECRNFDFKEKEEVDKYYPQYYHKMDKVCYFSDKHTSDGRLHHSHN